MSDTLWHCIREYAIASARERLTHGPEFKQAKALCDAAARKVVEADDAAQRSAAVTTAIQSERVVAERAKWQLPDVPT